MGHSPIPLSAKSAYAAFCHRAIIGKLCCDLPLSSLVWEAITSSMSQFAKKAKHSKTVRYSLQPTDSTRIRAITINNSKSDQPIFTNYPNIWAVAVRYSFWSFPF